MGEKAACEQFLWEKNELDTKFYVSQSGGAVSTYERECSNIQVFDEGRPLSCGVLNLDNIPRVG